MNVYKKRYSLVFALILGAMVLVIVASSISTRLGASTLHAQLQPVSQWRLGYHRVEVCQSLDPSMVGWRLNLGPLSVSRLQHWQPSLTIWTNATVAGNSNSASK